MERPGSGLLARMVAADTGDQSFLIVLLMYGGKLNRCINKVIDEEYIGGE
jgi:hypothetical protein